MGVGLDQQLDGLRIGSAELLPVAEQRRLDQKALELFQGDRQLEDDVGDFIQLRFDEAGRGPVRAGPA